MSPNLFHQFSYAFGCQIIEEVYARNKSRILQLGEFSAQDIAALRAEPLPKIKEIIYQKALKSDQLCIFLIERWYILNTDLKDRTTQLLESSGYEPDQDWRANLNGEFKLLLPNDVKESDACYLFNPAHLKIDKDSEEGISLMAHLLGWSPYFNMLKGFPEDTENDIFEELDGLIEGNEITIELTERMQYVFDEVAQMLQEASQELAKGKLADFETLQRKYRKAEQQFKALRGYVIHKARQIGLAFNVEDIANIEHLKVLWKRSIEAERSSEELNQLKKKPALYLESVLNLYHKQKAHYKPLVRCFDAAIEMQIALDKISINHIPSYIQSLNAGKHLFNYLVDYVKHVTENQSLDENKLGVYESIIVEALGKEFNRAILLGNIQMVKENKKQLAKPLIELDDPLNQKQVDELFEIPAEKKNIPAQEKKEKTKFATLKPFNKIRIENGNSDKNPAKWILKHSAPSIAPLHPHSRVLYESKLYSTEILSPLLANDYNYIKSKKSGLLMVAGSAMSGIVLISEFLQNTLGKRVIDKSYKNTQKELIDFKYDVIDELKENPKKAPIFLIQVEEVNCLAFLKLANKLLKEYQEIPFKIVFLIHPPQLLNLLGNNAQTLHELIKAEKSNMISLRNWEDELIYMWFKAKGFKNFELKRLNAVVGNWHALINEFYTEARHYPDKWEVYLWEMAEQFEYPILVDKLIKSFGIDSPKARSLFNQFVIFGDSIPKSALFTLLNEQASDYNFEMQEIAQYLEYGKILNIIYEDKKGQWTLDPHIKSLFLNIKSNGKAKI